MLSIHEDKTVETYNKKLQQAEVEHANLSQRVEELRDKHERVHEELTDVMTGFRLNERTKPQVAAVRQQLEKSADELQDAQNALDEQAEVLQRIRARQQAVEDAAKARILEQLRVESFKTHELAASGIAQLLPAIERYGELWQAVLSNKIRSYPAAGNPEELKCYMSLANAKAALLQVIDDMHRDGRSDLLKEHGLTQYVGTYRGSRYSVVPQLQQVT